MRRLFMDKKEVGKEVLSDTIFEMIRNVGAKGIGELIKEAGLSSGKELAAELALETAPELVPIIGNAVRSYRINHRFSRIETFIQELEKKIDELYTYNKNLSGDNKEKFNELLLFALDSVGEYTQKEKIEYLVNGLETIIQAEDISFDIGYLYINTLNRLSLLDIAVVKLYNNPHAYFSAENTNVEFRNYQDILSAFKIEYYQYEAIRDNLYTIRLLERKNETNTKKDLKNIEKNLERLDKNISNLYSYLETVIKGRTKNPKLKKYDRGKVKIETDDKYVISRFGRDFFRYFIRENKV